MKLDGGYIWVTERIQLGRRKNTSTFRIIKAHSGDKKYFTIYSQYMNIQSISCRGSDT